MTTITAKELSDNGYLYAQKAPGTKVVHLWSDALERNLCGVTYMLAYFAPVEGWPVCQKCLRIYESRRGNKCAR